jgi:hypothetical protein
VIQRAYRIAVCECSTAFRRANRASYKMFTSEVDGVKPTARLQKIIPKDNSYHIGNFRLPSGEFTKADQEVADHLLETHFPGCKSSSDEVSVPLESVYPPTEANWLEASKIISEDKTRWGIAGFRPFKTAGENGVFPALLKNGIEVLISPMQESSLLAL